MSKFPIVEPLDDSRRFPPLLLALDIEQELDELRQAKTEMPQRIEECRRSMIAQIHQRVLEVERVEQFSQEQLALLKKQLSELITLAEWQYRFGANKAYQCPHCGQRIFINKKAANKIVKCPYRDCRGRIKVSI